MMRDHFIKTLDHDAPPEGWPAPLKALWWENKGDWGKAHELCMNEETNESDWVHAFLHRVEGSLGNAEYWYSRAGIKVDHSLSFDNERLSLVDTLWAHFFPVPDQG